MKKRIILFLIRWYETFERPLPKWLERACDKDIALGLELDEERELSSELNQKPDWSPVKPNPFQAERIIACLEDEERPVETRTIPWREISIGVAACIAIAITYQWIGSQPNPSDSELIVEKEPVEDAFSADEPQVLIANINRAAENRDWKNPLDQEIEYVLGDAKGAIHFLADSFVPSTFLSSEREG